MPINPVDPTPIDGIIPYTIIEERYVQSPTLPDPDSGELIQGSSRYVEILFEESNYDYLPTDGVAIGSLAFCLDSQYMLYFSSNGYWEIVGDNGGGGLPDDGGGGGVML